MQKYEIDTRRGHDYIQSIEPDFTLIIILPDKQGKFYELDRQVVGAEFFGLDADGLPDYVKGSPVIFCRKQCLL